MTATLSPEIALCLHRDRHQWSREAARILRRQRSCGGLVDWGDNPEAAAEELGLLMFRHYSEALPYPECWFADDVDWDEAARKIVEGER